jgi:DNA-binding NarL/FixJ family response regulator
MASIRVGIVAASAILRKGLEALVASGPGLVVAGVANDATNLESWRADVLLWEAAAAEDLPATNAAVISLVLESDGPGWIDFLRAGGLGVLPADPTPDELYAAIQAAAVGLTVAPHSWYSAPSQPAPSSLTARELEVLNLLAEGAPNKIIAYRLGISEHTVKFHLNSLFAKLGVNSRTEAVMTGMRQGLLTI